MRLTDSPWRPLIVRNGSWTVLPGMRERQDELFIYMLGFSFLMFSSYHESAGDLVASNLLYVTVNTDAYH